IKGEPAELKRRGLKITNYTETDGAGRPLKKNRWTLIEWSQHHQSSELTHVHIVLRIKSTSLILDLILMM
ncbi:MAG: hypothetical protein ACR2IS_00770, partial [Nitrososphaeraceae archaeon]